MTLADRVGEAPSEPGVYLFLGRADLLLYVGKAVDLRKRLQQHLVRDETSRHRKLIENSRDVRWIACADELDALALEADLLVSLVPPYNALLDDDYWFVDMGDGDRGMVRLTLAREPGERSFGGFPHLGKGKVGRLPKRCNAGYSALLRLVWAANTDRPEPARLRGTSPPSDHTTPIDDVDVLADLLSGRTDALIATVESSTASAPEPRRRGLLADVEEARTFFEIGPARMASLRERHDLQAPVDLAAFRTAVAADAGAAAGVELFPDVSGRPLMGRRMERTRRFRRGAAKPF